MSEIADQVQEAVEETKGSHDGLATAVAILVALTATFMALCNVKDGNVVQAMQQAQTRAVDQWAYYQAKSTKQNMAESAVETLIAIGDVAPNITPEARVRLEARVTQMRARIAVYETEKGAIKAEAERLEKEYDRLNVHDDQFDMAEANMSVAIALYGITILTRRRWMLGVASAFALFGVVLGVAGFMGFNLHPDWLAKLLG